MSLIIKNEYAQSAYNALQKCDAETQLNIANLLLGVFSSVADIQENEQLHIELMELVEAFS